MEGYSVGIDFGTCSIKVSHYDSARQNIRQLKLDKSDNNSDYKVPNVIEYRGRTEYLVGARAKKNKVYNLKHIVDLIKRKLELESWSRSFQELGFTLSAQEIATDIFHWIKARIEEQGRPVEHAVITVPVCFTEIQKAKVVQAAKEAGINIKDTITEPVAALFSVEELFGEACDENVVVFDFGGATLDLCLFHLENDGEGHIDIDIETSAGIDLGGVDFTEMLYRDVLYPKHKEEIDREIQDDILNQMEAEFLETAERMKVELFEDEEESCQNSFQMKYNAGNVDVELTLEEAIQCLERHQVKEQIVAALDALFEDSSDIEKEDVTMVKTFGGTSRIRYIREILEEYFGEDVFDQEDYDSDEAYHAVADGAARYLGILLDEDSDVSISNAIPYYVGVNQNGCFKPVIKRNQKYGIFTPYRGLPEIVDLEADCWRVVLYQSFSEENSRIEAENGAVYLGEILLEKEKYEGYDAYLYKFGTTDKGKVVGKFFGVTEENTPVLLEEKEIIVGGMTSWKR